MKVLVTGGAGFIGSAVVRHIIAATDAEVVNLDKLTYAATLSSVASASTSSRYYFEQVDICDADELARVFRTHQPQAVMHLAAESHVDRSIDAPAEFIQTNIVGSYNLLEAATRYRKSLSGSAREQFRYHHVSTDEVFGSLEFADPPFTEQSRLDPHSPYAASKAASDHLSRAWCHTFGLPVVMSNCSNNYGPFQFPEKLIPLMILKALGSEPLPIYGTGENVRDWLHVDDHARALWTILTRGQPGESYNVGGNSERSNLDVVHTLCDIIDRLVPGAGAPRRDRVTHVADRPGHDLRYAIDARKIEATLGWTPRESFESGLEKTVRWYIENESWWQAQIGRGDGRRQGTGEPC